MNKLSKNSLQQSKLILEELEERRLFSGGIEGLIATDLDSDANALYSDIDGSQTQSSQTDGAAAVAEQQTQEIVFVDAEVDNYQQLVDDLHNNADSSRNIEVVVLERDRDGIEQISEFLSNRDDLDAIHIISHGDDGSVQLGNTSLNADTLEQNSLNIAFWANSFAETGDILIYGCNLAETETGQSLIDDLSSLTLADVAASTDMTGHADLGGDWVLEFNVGQVETAVAFSGEAQEAWQAVLATDAEDAFSGYPVGNLDGNAGGAGFTGAWNDSAGFSLGTNEIDVVATGLTHPTGGPDAIDAVQLNHSGGGGLVADSFYTRTLASPYGTVDETIWVSFLIQPQEMASNDSYMGLVLGDGAFANDDQLFVGYMNSDYVLTSWADTGTEIAAPAVSGETAFLVLRLDIFASGNETATLFVNPNSGEATPSVSGTTSVLAYDIPNLDTISLAGRAVSDNPSLMSGIRIGSSFADVAPTANVAPVLSATGSGTVVNGEEYTLNLSASEAVDSWTINWGDGTIETVAGNPPSVTHVYGGTGLTYNISVAATDVNGTYHQSELLATSDTNATIFRFSPITGGFVSEFGTGNHSDPAALVVGPDGMLYAADYFDNTITRYNAQTGALVDSFATSANPADRTAGVAFGPDGNIYVAMETTHNILRFDASDGSPMGEFVAAGSGGLLGPQGIQFTDRGTLLVASYATDSVIEYDAYDGSLVGTFVTAGSAGLDGPVGIRFGPNGDLFIGGRETDTIYRFDGTTGAPVAGGIFVSSASGGLDQPLSFEFGPDGHLYVVGHGDDTVRRYDGNTGAYIDDYIAAGTGGLNTTIGMVFLPSHQVDVTNAAPVVTATGTTLAYTENDAATPVDPGLALSDLENTDLTGATVTISANYVNGNDTLAFTNQLGISGSWDAGTGVLTLSGDASVADYQTALQSVTFVNSSEMPSTLTRTVSFQVDDGTDLSNVATRDISVDSVNDAPVILSMPASLNATEQVALDLSGSISFTDSDAFTGTIEATLSVVSGTLDLTAGINAVTITGSGTNSVTVSGNLTSVWNAIQGNGGATITYTINSDTPPGTDTLSLLVDDKGNTGSGGAKTASANTTINITAVNDAPTFINGAVGNWSFDEGSDTTTADNAYGTSTGTLNGANWTTGGQFGDALQFDGVDDYVEILDAPELDISGPEFSASLWVKPDRGPGTEDMFFMKGDRQGIANVNYYLSWKDTGKMTWAFKSDGGFEYIDMDVTLPTVDEWNHVAVVFDRPTVSIYINGTEYTSSVGTGGTSMDKDLVANDEPLWIGAGRDGGSIVTAGNFSAPFSGAIDELAIFDRALTTAEIEAIRTGTPPVVTASTFSLDENSADNTVVGTVVANDPDIGDTLLYDITAGNTGGAFAIDANGQITVANSAALDFETNPVFNLTIEATDNGSPNLSDTTTVTITLNNVAPTTISTTGTGSVANGGLYTLNLSADEDVTSWTINWGDGSFETIAGNPSSVTHVYNGAGLTYNVMVSATDSDGVYYDNQLLITSNGNDSIFRFAPITGDFIDEIGVGNHVFPGVPVIGPDGLLYVSDFANNEIMRYNAQTGALDSTFVSAGSGGLSAPAGMAFGPDGNLFVTSHNSHEVMRYSGVDGSYIDTIVSAGSGGLNGPSDIIFTENNTFLLASHFSNEVLEYDSSTGAFLGDFVTPGSGGINGPHMMALGPDGNLYVGSYFSDEVMRYDIDDGSFIDIFVTAADGGLDKPIGLEFGPDGQLYVVSHGDNRVLRFDGETGAYIDDYTTPGAGGLTNAVSAIFIPSHQVDVTNAAPVVTATGTTLAYTENDAATPVDPGLTLSDLENTDLTGATVTISANYENGYDELAFTNQLGISGSWDAGTGVLTLSGDASVADYQTALQSVTFVNTSETPSTLTRTVSFQVDDGTDLSNVATRDISVDSVNDAPIANADSSHLVFDGDDFVQVADHASLQMTNNLTMEAWINHSGNGTGSQIILNKEGEYELGITSDTGEIKFAIANAPTWDWHDTGFFVAANEWTHVAVTYDAVAGEAKTFINGNLVDTYSQSGAVGDVYPGFGDLFIGGRENATTQRFQGSIDDVRIWGSTRSEVEIQNNYSDNLSGAEPGLAGNWRLNEADGTLVADQSPNGNNGTLGGVEGAASTPTYDGYFTDEDTLLVIPAVDGVLANDFDAEGDTLTVTNLDTTGMLGTLVLNTADGSFSYDPRGAFDSLAVGEIAYETFTYSANDGALDSNIVSVTITVIGVNDVPVATGNTVIASEDVPLVINASDFTFTDVEGDSLASVTITGLNLNGGTLTHSGGAVTVTNGMTITAAQLADLTFTSAANDSTDSSFTYTVNDADTGVTSAVMNITVNAVNDVPVATGNTVIATEDMPLVIGPADFNFTDVESDSLASVTITGLNLNGGTLTHSGGAVAVTNGMIITAAQLADLTFTSASNDSTNSSFTYTVNDAGLGVTSAVMNITVNAVNDVPVATGNTVIASEDVPLVINASDFTFTDVEGDSLASVTITGLNLNGGTLTHSGGAVTVTNGMTITAAQLADLTFTSAANDSTDASFTYTVNDAGLGVTSAVMNITLNAANDAPVAVNDGYTVNEDETLDVDWWDTDWTARRTFTMDNSAQGENLVDFPVLVVLDPTPVTGNIDYAKTQDDGVRPALFRRGRDRARLRYRGVGRGRLFLRLGQGAADHRGFLHRLDHDVLRQCRRPGG